ncbi:MAG: response regulator [Candidatus Obscuribacterales bacterium]|jgi:DNA-binding NarL/FixJ family response regulator|nr:response regulator [Candidatus Obscuribacterales bacterium]
MAPKLTKVLIAEDSPTTRAMLKTVLQRASDMEVVGDAESGDMVLNKAELLHPDVVLMDVGLPGLSGLEATKRIKQSHPEVKVIMVTANESDAVIFDAFSAGADGYYLKSNSADSLLQAVRSVVSGAAWLHPAIASRVLRSCVIGATKLIDRKRNGTADSAHSKQYSKHQNVNKLVAIARDFEDSGKLDDAELILEAAVALCEKLSGAHDPEVTSIITLQADILYTQEKFVQAERLYLKALELRHQSLGYENAEVAQSLENLANLYDTRSNYAEAEHYYYWSLKIREKVDGPDNPLTHETCSKLAWVYRAQGKIDQADEMTKRATRK